TSRPRARRSSWLGLPFEDGADGEAELVEREHCCPRLNALPLQRLSRARPMGIGAVQNVFPLRLRQPRRDLLGFVRHGVTTQTAQASAAKDRQAAEPTAS